MLIMSSSSSFPPPLTPRFRPTAEDEEPFLLPQYQKHKKPSYSFLKWRISLTRGRVVLLGVLFSLGVWGLIMLAPTPTQIFGFPVKITVPPVDFNSIEQVNATIIPGDKVTRWTVDIPRGIQEPLRAAVYSGICSSVHEVAGIARSHGEGHGHGAGHPRYYWYDDLFVDPADSGEQVEVEQGTDICDQSLTYLLESKNAGFGVTLMGLWSAYGLAKKEGRSFFVNDRDWAWGPYTSYFLPFPTPKCAPPPPHWLLPCPHSVKHLVVASSTHSFIFGHSFADEFEDPRKMGVLRQINIFSLVREGYEALFRLGLRPEDQDAVEVRKKSLVGQIVSMHIRRGDKKALDWEYKKNEGGYVPLSKYVEVAMNISDKHGDVIYASDDVSLYSKPELARFFPAQGQSAIQGQWLGELEVPPSQSGFVAADFWELDFEQRIALGRSYLRDLKILGELATKPDARAVCDVASTTCRLVAVIMGWEHAILAGSWRNIDGDFDWNGVSW